MGFIEFLLLGVGLSMDAFAVAICKGLHMRSIRYRDTFMIALFFGGFQALMPLLGWFLGSQFESYIAAFDHWIAFILLAFIGGKMIWEVLHGSEEEDEGGCSEKLDLKELFVLAVATSIDALAVGISLAIVGANIWEGISIIGVTTFLFSVAGVFIGNRFGIKYKSKAELCGGIILVLIGLKILLEGLGVIAF